tara:strand:+ start:642 stop:893 length:252 start_codon:yes stop_codon:yes gene_type:complete
MRKLIDLMAVTSFIVSVAVVGGGVYLYNQKDALTEKAKDKATEVITDIVSSAITDSIPGDITELDGGIPVPSSPAGQGFPLPF